MQIVIATNTIFSHSIMDKLCECERAKSKEQVYRRLRHWRVSWVKTTPMNEMKGKKSENKTTNNKYQQPVLLQFFNRICVMSIKRELWCEYLEFVVFFCIFFCAVLFFNGHGSHASIVVLWLMVRYNKLKLQHRNWASSLILHFYAIDVYNIHTQTVAANMLDCWYSTECCFPIHIYYMPSKRVTHIVNRACICYVRHFVSDIPFKSENATMVSFNTMSCLTSFVYYSLSTFALVCPLLVRWSILL